MALPYRTVLHLPPTTDLVRLAEQEMQSWLEARRKVDPKRRAGFTSGEFFQPGVHSIGKGRTLSVARLDGAGRGDKQLLLQFVEVTKVGTWQVDVLVLDSSEGNGRPDTLLIEARRTDNPDAEGQVDPPGLVSSLLARETVRDSRTTVTAEPQLIRASFADEVFEAIVDDRRSVTVIVASSLGPQFDDRTRDVVRQLTSKVTGVAAVYVLTNEATQELNRRLPRTHQLEEGRVRTFLPRVDLENPIDGRRHRVLGPQTFARAIQGKRVAEYLQRSFAIQTRGSLLSNPLPRQLRRQWALLGDELARIAREAEVERRVQQSQAESRKERTKAASKIPLLERLQQMLGRWLGRDVPEVDVRALDELSDYVERQRFAAESATQALVAAEAQVQVVREQHDELVHEFEFRGLELADAERVAAKLADRVKYLQQALTEAGQAAQAHAVNTDEVWEWPTDLGELALRLVPGTSDHPAVERVVFTGDLDRAVEIDARDQNGLYVQRCWEFVRVLHDYAEMKSLGAFAGGVHAYLNDDTHDGFRVTPTRHATTEAKTTMDQWGSERVFPVPKDVNPSGSVVMEAHFKAGQQNTFAPRLYYFDDTPHSGKVYVGYIGRHLTNTKTKNS